MKIKINLLPYEQRPPRWNYARLMLLPVVVMLLSIGVWYVYDEFRSRQLETQLVEMRMRYEAMASSQQQLQVDQTRLAAIAARERILLQLSSGRNSWHGTMAHLGSIMPRRVWLNEIGSAQKGVVLMKGSAVSYADLVAFLGKMEQDRTFLEPTLLKAEQNAQNSLTQFEVSTKIGGAVK